VQYPYAGSLEANLTKLEYDLYYIRHLGPQLDARIVLRTILTILGRGGR
jgi:lipopolysaccharide/colanic/teichoic acid biosynthesis glycosyltransferase